MSQLIFAMMVLNQTCIDLMFTNQPSAFTSVEVIPHHERQSKHLIAHGKINFSFPSPPPYIRKVWEYNKASPVKINQDLSDIDLVGLFYNKTVEEIIIIIIYEYRFVG